MPNSGRCPIFVFDPPRVGASSRVFRQNSQVIEEGSADEEEDEEGARISWKSLSQNPSTCSRGWDRCPFLGTCFTSPKQIYLEMKYPQWVMWNIGTITKPQALAATVSDMWTHMGSCSSCMASICASQGGEALSKANSFLMKWRQNMVKYGKHLMRYLVYFTILSQGGEHYPKPLKGKMVKYGKIF